MSLADIRRDYQGEPLSEIDSDPDPVRQFARWMAHARRLEADPTACALATAAGDGRPSVRTILLKGVDERGFVFFTNYNSRKARELDSTGRASLLFYWQSVVRQVRVDGTVEKVSEADSDAYFATRPLGSRIGAVASAQSRPLATRDALDRRVREIEAELAGRDVLPRPGYWGGYRLAPDAVELWQGRPSRLHDRLLYTRSGERWTIVRLSP